MKRLLVLFTFRLVLSDKLDRTYLPPPGATFAGGNPYQLQAPLEYSLPINPGVVKNGLTSDIMEEKPFKDATINESLDTKVMKSRILPEYATSIYPNEFPRSELDTSVETARPKISSYNSFPQKPPNTAYLPSRQSNTQQPYRASTYTINADDGTLLDITMPGYYNVPVKQFRGNNFANFIANSESTQYPKEVNGGFLSGYEMKFTPKIANSDQIAQNFQPNAFGYYGGNPMIMTVQKPLQKLKNNEFVTFEEKEYNSNVMPLTQNTNRMPAQPFQTPLVRTNMQNRYNSRNSKMPTTIPQRQTGEANRPIKTISPMTEDIKRVELNQRSNSPINLRLRPKRPQAESDRNAITLNSKNVITPEKYLYSFDTSNGIHVDRSGTATDGVKANGSYSYTGDDGKIYSITYTADKNGFQPRGDHLPTPPPIPEAIKKVIEKAATNSQTGNFDDGSYDDKRYGHMNYQTAMDRYRPFKDSDAIYVNRRIGNKVFRPTNVRPRSNVNTNISKSSNSLPAATSIVNENKPVNELIINAKKNDVNNNKIKNLFSIKRRPVSKTNNRQQNIFKNENENILHLNENNKNTIRNEHQMELTPIDGNEELMEYKFKNPSSNESENHNKNKNTELQNTINIKSQKSNSNYKLERDGSIFNNFQDSPSQLIKYRSGDVDKPTITDNGYYYVPPIITFSPLYEQSLNYKNNTYTTKILTSQPNVDTVASRRIAVDGNLNPKTIKDNLFSTQSITRENNRDSTRKPYISGPNDQSRKDSSDVKQKSYPQEKSTSEFKYTNNDLDLSTYPYTTTPMSSQNIQYTSSNDYPNEYYQTTSYPIAFEPFLSTSVNRNITDSEIPNVRVTQDFITTTYRPTVLDDGVLEVNQNVKIYGFGRPESTVTPTIANKISNYNNDLYTPNIPKEEFKFVAPNNDQRFSPDINQGYNYGDKFYTTVSPIINSDVMRGSNDNPDFGIKPMEEIDGSSEFGSAYLTPGQEYTSATDFTKNPSPIKNFIGADFSGPKQPQRFDPTSGYYY